MQRHVKHVLTLCFLATVLAVSQRLAAVASRRSSSHGDLDPAPECSRFVRVLLQVVRVLSLLPLPYAVLNFLGFVCLHTHPSSPKVSDNMSDLPLIRFRVVTRGTYPDFVRHNVRRNQAICDRFGLSQYVIEVVTDAALELRENRHVREVLVPAAYKSVHGTLFKARALHFCLEQRASDVTPLDWLVHLDEETILTESALAGIVNFIRDDRWDLGQGVISYANEHVECWLTTLADCARVGIDYGIIRFALHVLHAPVFAWKGSFIVVRAEVEAAIGFDFGPRGSLAEDCCFALRAWGRRGRRFGWVEGEMWEQSTFSVGDYLRQRKRWMHGLMLILLDPEIRPHCKLGVACIVLGWPLGPSAMMLTLLCPLPVPSLLASAGGFIGGVMTFVLAFGAFKSFAHRCRAKMALHVLLCACAVVASPVTIVMEALAFAWAIVGFRRGTDFHLVKKEPKGGVIRV